MPLRIVKRLAHIWNNWAQPFDSVIDPEKRRQSHLMAAISLILLLSIIPFYFLPVLLGQFVLTLFELILMLITAGIIYAAYRRARAGSYQTAALTLAVFISLTILASAADAPYSGSYLILYYLAVPILWSSILLSTRATLLVMTGSAGAILLVISQVEGIEHGDAPFVFVIVVAMMAIIIRRHTALLEGDRRAKLAASEARYRSLFEAISDGILVHRHGVVTDVNPAFERITGWSRAEVVGSPLFNLVTAESRPVVQAQIDHPDISSSEWTVLRKDDGTFPAEVTATHYEVDDDMLQVLALRDISERKLAEDQRLALSLEQSKVKLMQRFISDASHDLRTPMAVIYSSLHLLNRAATPEARERHFSRLESSVTTLNALVDNLLTITRLEKASRDGFDFKPADLNTLAGHIVQEYESAAQNKHITLNFSPTPLPLIAMDEDELARALRQLVMNAINYTPGGGFVNVRTALRSDNEIAVIVEDTGIGMTPEQKAHIFEMFFRSEEARKTDRGGMGLGLAICQHIVAAHNGRIDVESAPGAGSTFTIILPCHEALAINPA